MKYIGNHTEKKPPKLGTMDIVLIFVAITLIAFTVVMVWLFATCGSIPDTLCTCVFTVLGGECGVMGWIKTNKDKLQKRQWDKEDLARKDEKENEQC